MRLGVMLPLTDIGGEPNVMRDFAQAAEETRLHQPRPGRPRARRERREPARMGRSQHLRRSVPRPLRRVRLPGWRLPRNHRILHPGADPGAAPGGAGRQAGGKPRRAMRRALPARCRRRLEPGGIHRPERELLQPRPAFGRAGAGDAGAMGGTARHLQGQMAHHRGRRHQPACRCTGESRCGSAVTSTRRWNASPHSATAGS